MPDPTDLIHREFDKSRDADLAMIGEEPPSAYIQWKGTDVCMDVYCECGCSCHVHGEFVYMYRCPNCKATFVVGSRVRLYRMPEDASAAVDATDDGRMHLGVMDKGSMPHG